MFDKLYVEIPKKVYLVYYITKDEIKENARYVLDKLGNVQEEKERN